MNNGLLNLLAFGNAGLQGQQQAADEAAAKQQKDKDAADRAMRFQMPQQTNESGQSDLPSFGPADFSHTALDDPAPTVTLHLGMRHHTPNKYKDATDHHVLYGFLDPSDYSGDYQGT